MGMRKALVITALFLLAPVACLAQEGNAPFEEPTLEIPSLEEELGQASAPPPAPDDAPVYELPPEMPDVPDNRMDFKLIPPKPKTPPPAGMTPPLDFSLPPPSPPQAETEAQRMAKTVTLKGLNKITARVSTFEAAIDQPVRFGALRIIARNCHKRPAEEIPETSAFLEINDLGPAYLKQLPQVVSTMPEHGHVVFSGWMFASSPALSALEHPIYDISVIDCSTSAPGTSNGIE